MLPAVSILQLIGFAVLLVAMVTWVTGLVRLSRRERAEASGRLRRQQLLSSVPRQAGPGGPPWESVELSAAEREAFAGLVRRLTRRS
ncbi:hypothetical protein AB0I10_00700 [Streptomyces sp. NPDC050636]|uniref:hypothetical protein n=1 Tax=Streptomyces sp. NPDC050636 TaxID=3154510 RepID=UPI0034189CAA